MLASDGSLTNGDMFGTNLLTVGDKNIPSSALGHDGILGHGIGYSKIMSVVMVLPLKNTQKKMKNDDGRRPWN